MGLRLQMQKVPLDSILSLVTTAELTFRDHNIYIMKCTELYESYRFIQLPLESNWIGFGVRVPKIWDLNRANAYIGL